MRSNRFATIRAISRLGMCAAVVVLAAAACGDDKASSDGVASLNGDAAAAESTTTTTISAQDAALAFAQCLRDNGLPNIADPTVGTDGRIDMRSIFESSGVNRQSPEFQNAISKCRDKLPEGGPGGNRADRQKFQDPMVNYAQCLRDEGLTVNDPDLSTFGPGGRGGPGGPGAAGAAPGATGTTGSSGATGASGGAATAPVPASDPGPGGGGQPVNVTDRLAEMLGVDRSDPKTVAAMDKCSTVLANLPGPGGNRDTTTTTAR